MNYLLFSCNLLNKMVLCGIYLILFFFVIQILFMFSCNLLKQWNKNFGVCNTD